MATRRSKSRNIQVTADGLALASELIPHDADTKYMGPEPYWPVQPTPEGRQGAVVQALNWYNRFYDRKEAKIQLCDWARESLNHPQAAQLSRVDDKQFNPSLGWLARTSLRGLQLTESETLRLKDECDRLLATLSKKQAAEAAATAVKTAASEAIATRPNVQEIMRERAHEAGGEFEGWLDDYILAGARGEANINPVGPLSARNVLPQHVSMLSEVWTRRKAEYQAAIDGSDPQVVEGYSHYGKLQLRALVKFCDAVLAGLNGYVNVKRAAKAPRVRKAVPPEKQAAKVKYLKTFKDTANKLDLTSLHPAKIIGATEVWAYDTAKRKLWYLVADSHVGSLGIKGTTVTGFDTAKSGVKTLRKPGDTLKKLITAGKPAARKLFTEIKAVQTQPNGRTNDAIVLLKAY